MASWVLKLPEPLKNEIVLIGLSAVLRKAKFQARFGKTGIRKQRNIAKVYGRVKAEKARSFDRIVEMLDHLDVNGKVLGDCTRADLLRAAVRLEEQSEDAKVRAAMYRELAKIVGNQTVREASNRGQIVALLTTTFQEAA